jgi:hypothetical protein
MAKGCHGLLLVVVTGLPGERTMRWARHPAVPTAIAPAASAATIILMDIFIGDHFPRIQLLYRVANIVKPSAYRQALVP